MQGMATQNAGPSASQASGRVFRDASGQSLRIFVEASDVLNRPKIIHTLKSNGATIVHSPDEATLILVDIKTTSGGQFVQDWGSEPGKVVLDVNWVLRSVERGSAFLAHENWGGFSASESASGTVQESPLPTPRETPSDASASQAESSMQNQPPDGSQFPPPNAPFGFPFQPQMQQPQMSQQIPNGFPPGAAIPPAGIPSNPNAPIVLPAHLVAQLVGLVSQQGLNPASMGIPMMPHMGAQMPMMPGQPMPQGYPYMSQPGMFVQPQFPLSQQPGMFPPQHMMPPPMSQMQAPEPGSPTHYQSPTPASPDRHSSISQARRQSSMSDTARGSPMAVDKPTSRKRKSPSVDHASSSSGRRAGKARADGDRSSKHRRVSYPTDEAPLPYPDSSPPPAQPRRAPASPSEKLFEQPDGEPMKFYVQIDIRPRTKIADAIKKNGGKLVPDIADADYVILSAHSSRTFEERLKQAGNYGKLAIKPQWVFQCVEQNRIVEVDAFVFEGLVVEKKRGRPSATGKRFILTGPNAPSMPQKSNGKASQLLQDEDEDMADDDDDEEEEVEDTLVKGKAKSTAKRKVAPKEPVKKVEKKAAKSSAKASPPTDTDEEPLKSRSKGKSTSTKAAGKLPSNPLFWRASPPPPTRVVQHMPGKNMYTKEDMDYVDEYLPILYFRDPDMSVFAVSEKLHEKMPHHTQKSWQTHITHASRRDRLEKIKRQAHIARRKAAASSTQHASQPLDSDVPEATQRAITPPSAAPLPPSFDAFETLTKFLAAGGADELEDSEVWQGVHRKHPELSPEGWEAYWGKHSQDITAAVNRLNGVTDSMEEANEAPMQYGDGHIIPKPEPE